MMNKHLKILPFLLIGLTACNKHRLDMSGHNKANNNIANRTRNVDTRPEPIVVDSSKFADPTIDWMFKEIFGIERKENLNDVNENKFTLKILNDLLEFKGDEIIKEITFADTNIHAEKFDEHGFIADVHCRNEKGDTFIIEMQIATQDGWDNRMIGYVARDYGKQLKQGEGYEGMKPVHLLAITRFEMFPSRIGFLSHHRITEQSSQECFFPQLSWTVLELPKFKKTALEVSDSKDEWAYYFNNAKKADTLNTNEKLHLTNNEVMKEAYEIIERAKWLPEKKKLYEKALLVEKDKFAVLQARENKVRKEEQEKNKLENYEKDLEMIGSFLEDEMKDPFILKHVFKRGYNQEESDSMLQEAKRRRIDS